MEWIDQQKRFVWTALIQLFIIVSYDCWFEFGMSEAIRYYCSTNVCTIDFLARNWFQESIVKKVFDITQGIIASTFALLIINYLNIDFSKQTEGRSKIYLGFISLGISLVCLLQMIGHQIDMTKPLFPTNIFAFSEWNFIPTGFVLGCLLIFIGIRLWISELRELYTDEQDLENAATIYSVNWKYLLALAFPCGVLWALVPIYPLIWLIWIIIVVFVWIKMKKEDEMTSMGKL
jgi:hypothetical protein